MMSEAQKRNALQTCELLADKGEYEKALVILEAMECVVATWLKGKIYLTAAEDLSRTFSFKYYATFEMKSRYTNLLNEAHNHLYKTALLLPNASLEIREHLNPLLWSQISKVEHELAKNRPVEQEQNLDDIMFNGRFEQYDDQMQQNADSLTDQIADWNL